MDDFRLFFAYPGLHVPGTRKLEARCGPVQGLSRKTSAANEQDHGPVNARRVVVLTLETLLESERLCREDASVTSLPC